MMKLLDSGNLVLTKGDEESDSISVIWESFKNNPTDTFLPGMKMDEKLELVSWASPDNPAPGGFRFQQEADQYIIRKDRSIYYWKSGVSGDFISDDILPTISSLLLNTNGSNFDPTTLIRNGNYSRNITTSSSSSKTNMNMRLVMNSNGTLQYFTRVNVSARWDLSWLEPEDPCNKFGVCGKSASCNSKNNKSMCECLPGFEPISPDNWNSGVFFEGCRRTMPICSNKVEKHQIFRSLEVIKVGRADVNFEANSENECKEACLKDCNCQAYSFEMPEKSQLRGVTVNQACWIWSDDLNNIQFSSTDGGHKILLRLQPNIGAPGAGGKNVGGKNVGGQEWWIPAVIAVGGLAATIVIGIILVILFFFFLRCRRAHLEEKFLLELMNEAKEIEIEGKKGFNLKVYSVSSIMDATNCFSDENKLGEGGYGPVYKGLFDGQEIAIKRLSRSSRQGLAEFKNELIIVAKLQHTNLVQLLGFCIQGGEKMLVYEFMPHNSLDSYIFDQSKRKLFNWNKYFNIIEEIAQGILYLHKYSRLQIIHRDLKAGNILLDNNMNPKISDFGMARIFTTAQSEANTNRIVGTRGYMAPEYTVMGIFSTRSDVFSYGVLVLEIVSGRRSNNNFNFDRPLNLIGYAWMLWKENAALEIMHPALRDSCSEDRVLRCINVALLCVEDNPLDRPSMADVIYMLTSEGVELPKPKQPAFCIERRVAEVNSSTGGTAENRTINNLTVSVMTGR